MNPWHIFLFQPLVNLLIIFYQVFNNMGLAIIALTLSIRGAMFPITFKQLKTTEKMKQLAPELEKLKKEHGKDKQKFAQEQMKLYKKHGANPVAGCLPTIMQFIILIALFQALNLALQADGDIIARLNEILYPFLHLPEGFNVSTRFLYLDVSKPDLFQLPWAINILNFKIDKIPGLFLIAAALVHVVSPKREMAQKTALQKAQDKKKKSNESEDMASMMQSQMVFLAPVMTLVIGFRFASGLVLYWLSFSLFMLVQQLIIKNKQNKK